MKTVVLSSFTIKGLPTAFKVASKNEQNRKQIEEMLGEMLSIINFDQELVDEELIYEKFLQLDGYHKLYFYHIGTFELIVEVERLKIVEFSK